MKKSNIPRSKDQELPESFPKTYSEFYKGIKDVLIHGTKEQTDKMWKIMQKGKGDWVWTRIGIIAEALEAADAKGKEEFCLIAMKRHLKSKNAILLKETFTDSETKISYRQYKFRSGLIYRIPFATEGMDKYAYSRALNKKFIGDYIEMHSADHIEYISLETKEKVDAYNSGNFFNKNYKPKKG